MKYLGVEIDEKLDFKQHVDTTKKKMAKKVGFVGRIQQKLTKTAKTTIPSHHIWITVTRLYFSQTKNT
jgi:hypothetical protein